MRRRGPRKYVSKRPKKFRRKKILPKVSLGEAEVARILLELGIAFEKEKEFSWLINSRGNNLRFDFWLPAYDAAIEFDGAFHYTSGRQKYNDRHKNARCQENSVPLLRIPYWDFKDIKKIIKAFIKRVK